MSSRYAKQRFIPASELGTSALTVTGTKQDGSVVDVSGYSTMRLFCAFTRVAGTNVTFNIEESGSAQDTLFYRQAQPAPSSGTVVLAPVLFSRTTSSTENFSFELDVSTIKYLRIADIASASGTTDSLTIYAILATL